MDKGGRGVPRVPQRSPGVLQSYRYIAKCEEMANDDKNDATSDEVPRSRTLSDTVSLRVSSLCFSWSPDSQIT